MASERWLVEITGEAFDVDEFPFWYPSGEVYFIAEQNKTYLVGDLFETFSEASSVLETAQTVLEEYSEIIRLLQSTVRVPGIGIVYRESSDGTRQGFAFMSGSAVGRSKVHGTLTVQEGIQKQTQAQELLAASRTDHRLKVAVSLVTFPTSSWSHLYRCLEEVENYLCKSISDAGYCSGNERERFTRTANSAESAGRDARHGLGKFAPPKDPMTIFEARSFFSRLLQAVLREVNSRVLKSNGEV